MESCQHQNIVLLPRTRQKLRCRHCHLTIDPDELGGGCCPECQEVSGKRRYDFEKIDETEQQATRYRCEDCGIIIEC